MAKSESKEARVIYCSFLDYEELKALSNLDPIDERVRLVAVSWCEADAVYIEYTDGSRERVGIMDALVNS